MKTRGQYGQLWRSIKSVVVIQIVVLSCILVSGCDMIAAFIMTSNSHLPLYIGPRVVYGAEGSDTSRLVIKDAEGNYGYIDTSGKILIKPQFDNAHPFFEGLAAVEKDDRYGYIDTEGRTVIPFQYLEALDFHNGKALVGTKDLSSTAECPPLNCTIIDRKGTLIANTDYHSVGRYSNGMTWVGEKITDLTYLDENYTERTIAPDPSKTLRVSAFSEGFATFYMEGDRISYMDKTGKVPFEGNFANTNFFSEGLAAVIRKGTPELWEYIDTSGRTIIKPQFIWASAFGEGLACVCTESNKWIIIDKEGRKTSNIEISIDQAESIQEGLCAVIRQKPIDEKYDSLPSDEKYGCGFIDTAGKLVIDFQYDMVTPFKNGIAQVQVDGKIGYIDKTGKYIWEPK